MKFVQSFFEIVKSVDCLLYALLKEGISKEFDIIFVFIYNMFRNIEYRRKFYEKDYGITLFFPTGYRACIM